ncbi:MAG: septum formation initiator family protein [Candidatus Latescibacterota bacterium]
MGSGLRMATRPVGPPSVVARRPRVWPLLLLAGLGVAAYLFLAGDHSVRQLARTRELLAQAEAEAARLQAENDSLRHVLWLLDNDLGYVEKVAREEYGMSKKGELIYRLRPAEAAPERE